MPEIVKAAAKLLIEALFSTARRTDISTAEKVGRIERAASALTSEALSNAAIDAALKPR